MLIGNRVLRMIYHCEEEGWWVTSPDEPSLLIVGGESYEEAVCAVREGLDDMGLGYRALLHLQENEQHIWTSPTW